MSALEKVSTYLSLGISNIIVVVLHRFKLKVGLSRVHRIQASIQCSPFVNPVSGTDSLVCPLEHWQTSALAFGYWRYDFNNSIPQWHRNPLTGVDVKNANLDWWLIPDFDPVVGDIKIIWEVSRFDWVLAFAQKAKAGDDNFFARFNLWLEDWCRHNPPYKGPNWKCGQEASIRVMHLAMAAIILDQVNTPCDSMLKLIELHLQRIEPTISYAMAQDNNHGTSEAAAMFIGGSWLLRSGHSSAKRWERIGRKWLENRAKRLIALDGSFSQYSVNYHRVMLDTFSMVEIWRTHQELPRFSTVFYERLSAAAVWLYSLVNADTGDAPNIGANDGARLLQLTDSDYRDYRPAVQLAMVLFERRVAYSDYGVWDEPLKWLGITKPAEPACPPASLLFDNGGYAVLRAGKAMALLRYPRFRFRPSQADVLHLDLWCGEANLLRDAGTYSYNTDQKWMSYFSGTQGHNTVQFDGRDQMPKISRFLFGNWLKTSYIEPLVEEHDGASFSAGYRDPAGASHNRHVNLTPHRLTVIDRIGGFNNEAVLRWRMPVGAWELDGHVVSDGKNTLSVSSDVPIVRVELVQGWESRYYLDISPVVVLEVVVNQAGTLTTEYSWTI